MTGEDDLARLATSFNQMATSLQRQIRQLEELSRVQRRFVSDVSHELRTPLTTVRMAGDVLHDARDEFDPTTARAAELLQTELDRFETLLADLLEISRFDAGAAVLELDDVNLVDVAHRVVEATRPLAEQRDVRIVVRAPDHPCLAQADVRRVERIVRNLVTNAIDHAQPQPAGPDGPDGPDAGGSPEIVVLVASDEQAAAIAVRDYGVGLAPGESAMVFNRFWRADPARARTSGGTGLGLSISQEDAHLHGGWLQAWGRLGEGSQFRLTLRAAGRRRAAPEPVAARPGGRSGARRMSRRRRSLRRLLGLLLAVLLTCSLTACVGLPDDGPVVEAQTSGSGTRSDAMAINPLGPQPGQSPSEVVKGFLDAMQATPIRTDVAREFLAEPAKDVWNPEATVIYDAASLPRPSPEGGDLVDVKLTGANRIDERGSWQGAVSDDDLRFKVVPEDGEFRIAGPPDALIVPQSWYAQRFRQVSLYFFDPTSQVLVPDPVFVPRNADLPSTLVQRLIAGPAPEVAEYSRNLLPAGADPEISVPVSDDGLATVDIGGDVAMPGLLDSGLLVAQLAWTLRQVPSVRSLSVSVDGEPVTPAGQPEVSVTTGEPFAPYVAEANPLQFRPPGRADGRGQRPEPRRGGRPLRPGRTWTCGRSRPT